MRLATVRAISGAFRPSGIATKSVKRGVRLSHLRNVGMHVSRSFEFLNIACHGLVMFLLLTPFMHTGAELSLSESLGCM